MDIDNIISTNKKLCAGKDCRKTLKNNYPDVVEVQSEESVLTTDNRRNNIGTDDGSILYEDKIEQKPKKEVVNENTTLDEYDKYKAICSKASELSQVVRKQKTPPLIANQISVTQLDFTIPKVRYTDAEVAMENNNDSKHITFDKSSTLQNADPDILKEEIKPMEKNSSIHSHFTKNIPINSEVNVSIAESGHSLRSRKYPKRKELDYIFCDQCAWNGFPNEKIVRVLHGLRPEYEDGFIHHYTEYDYDPLGKSKAIHVHKYNQKIIDEQVRIALKYAGVVI